MGKIKNQEVAEEKHGLRINVAKSNNMRICKKEGGLLNISVNGTQLKQWHQLDISAVL